MVSPAQISVLCSFSGVRLYECACSLSQVHNTLQLKTILFIVGMLQIVPLEYDIACQRMQVIEDQLRQTPFLLGADFTAVDIVCGEVLVKASVSRPCASAYFL